MRQHRQRIDDDHLQARILSGDARAEEQLVRALEPRLKAMALVRGCADDARDLAQETLVDTIRNLRQGMWNGDGPLDAYVVSILRRKITRFRTREPVEQSERFLDSVAATGPDPQREAEGSQRQQRLLLALEQLSGSHRQILLLHYFEDRGVREIGRMLGIPRGTVLSRLHYARRSVARLMGRRERSGEAIKKAS